MAIDKLSRVSSVSAADSVPISSNGLGGDAAVAVQALADFVLGQVGEASGVPNDGSVTVDKLATETVTLIDTKIAAAVDAIVIPDPGTGSGGRFPVEASTAIPLDRDYSDMARQLITSAIVLSIATDPAPELGGSCNASFQYNGGAFSLGPFTNANGYIPTTVNGGIDKWSFTYDQDGYFAFGFYAGAPPVPGGAITFNGSTLTFNNLELELA